MTPAIVAIPARNEEDRIGNCLAALAMQRDDAGSPLPDGAFSILVYANGCTDGTAIRVERWARLCPHPVELVSAWPPAGMGNAGFARKQAMDLAARCLAEAGQQNGVILTTDADSTASPTWVSATLAAFGRGVDAVAGYIDAHPAEIVGLGPAFLGRGRLEDRFLRLAAEIDAAVDPQEHDPWPNHRVSSGASLAVTLAAYQAIGGLPPCPVGEDAALTRALRLHGFKVRHAMDVVVSTSCRLDGRAAGGAADTMRDRHADPDAPCDAGMVSARMTLRRAIERRRLRRLRTGTDAVDAALARRLGLERRDASSLAKRLATEPFEGTWTSLVESSPTLRGGPALRPSDLPRQIRCAEAILRRLPQRDQ